MPRIISFPRTQRRYLTVATVVVMIGAPGLAGSSPERATPDTARQQFQRNVDGYLAVRREATRAIPPLKVSADSREILNTVHALAAAIRAARPNAKAGDLFTPQVAKLFRDLIADDLRKNEIKVADLMADLNEEVPRGTPRPAVNQPFPWGRGAAMLPCLLATLPSLPQELQYRLVERDLVLLDVDADLVVDILVNAVPPVALPPGR